MLHQLKKLVLPAAFSLSFLLVAASANAASLNVHNLSSKAVMLLYISPAWADDFRVVDEQLGINDYIMPGDTMSFEFAGGNQCEFDLRAVFTDGTSLEHYGADLCSIGNWWIEN